MRRRLTRLALQLVDREGREACSLRRLGQSAEISRSTPYSYFRDKEDLLDSVRQAALHRLADRCERSVAKATTVPERLAAVGRAYVTFALRHPTLYDLIFEARAGGAEHWAAIRRYRDLAEAPLREAQSLGLINLPPERLGHVLWAATHGAISLHRAKKLRHGVSLKRVLADLGDTLAFGFVPRGPQ